MHVLTPFSSATFLFLLYFFSVHLIFLFPFYEEDSTEMEIQIDTMVVIITNASIVMINTIRSR